MPLEEFDINESDVILQQASYTFDTFVEELLSGTRERSLSCIGP